jgi:hypothetical protein
MPGGLAPRCTRAACLSRIATSTAASQTTSAAHTTLAQPVQSGVNSIRAITARPIIAGIGAQLSTTGSPSSSAAASCSSSPGS